MISYLTLWALKADDRSLKSSNIRGRALHRASSKGNFSNCVHPFIHGPALPVAIFLGFHFFEARLEADACVHGLRL